MSKSGWSWRIACVGGHRAAGLSQNTFRRMSTILRDAYYAIASANGKERFGNTRDETNNALRLARERERALEIVEKLHKGVLLT
jgi:hypothetical protein